MNEDPLEEYDTVKEYVRDLFEEDEDLTESDTKLFLRVIEDATGIALPVDAENVPKVGTVTRVSRELRRNEGYEDLARDEVTEKREEKREALEEHHSSSDDVIFQDGEIVS